MVRRPLALLLFACAASFADDDAPYLVLVTEGAGELYQKAAEVVASIHPKATVRTFDPARLDDLLPDLQKAPPRYVCLVVPREVVDVRIARRLFLLSTRVDDDPFPDFAYGLVTGDDGGAALGFARAIEKATKQRRANRVLQVMTHDGDASTKGSERIESGSSPVERCWLSVGSDDTKMEDQLALFANRDIITITAHGDVGGMSGGYWSTHLDRSCPDLGGAVVVSSVCYSGCVSRRFEVGDDGKVEEEDVEPVNSFALAILRHGAGAYLAGADTMHGLYAGLVYDAILLEGASLGDAVKALQDRMVMEMIDRSFPPERLLEMERLSSDEQIATVANLVLYGDPALRLYASRIRRPTLAGVKKTEGGQWLLHFFMEVREFEAADHLRSKYRSNGDRWGTECAFTLPLRDVLDGLDPKAITVQGAKPDALRGATARFAVEKRGAEKILHVVVPFDADAEAVSEQVAKEGYRLELAIEGREGH